MGSGVKTAGYGGGSNNVMPKLSADRVTAVPARAYDTAQVFYRTVNPEGHVAYLQNFYSVPWQRIGELLPLRIGCGYFGTTLQAAGYRRR